MGYKPISRKIADAIYLLMAHTRPYVSVPLWSVLVIPIVYMAQIVILAFASNLPAGMILGVTLMASALMEELAKSIGIFVLADHGVVKSYREILVLSFLSALGFFLGEKLLVLLSISMVAQASISSVLFGEGLFLLAPLVAHLIFTAIVSLLKIKANLLNMAALMRHDCRADTRLGDTIRATRSGREAGSASHCSHYLRWGRTGQVPDQAPPWSGWAA